MDNMTFAQLCALFVAADDEVERLSAILPQYRSDEYPYVLERAKTRRDEYKAEIKLRARKTRPVDS